ncbi:MAG: hypothetical protein AAF433_16455 [Bacteroidota bacterium]
MSHPREQILLSLHPACTSCYEHQLRSLEAAQLVSSPVTVANLQLLLHYRAIEQLDPFPALTDEQVQQLEDLKTILATTADLEVMRAKRAELIKWMAALDNNDFSQEALEAQPRTDNGLNKRMRDELFQMKRKIRVTRRRLHDENETYDKDAFISTRNQLFLCHNVYLEQLRLDLVSCTHAEVAEVEQILMPAIVEASGSTFVERLSKLRDFILARILPEQPADPTDS